MNQQKQPVVSFPLESPEKWAKILAAAEKGDAKKLREAVEEMELSVKLAQVFITAVNEEAEIAGIVAAGKGMAERIRSCRARVGHLGAEAPATFEKSEQIAAQRADLMAQAVAAERAVSAAERASTGLRWLHCFFSELFGKKLPPHSGYLSSTCAAAKTSDALRAVGVSDFYGSIGAWRQVGQVDQTLAERRRRTYSSFNPILSKR